MSTTVKVGFSTSRRLASRIIRWATRSKVSHAWLLIEDSYFGVDMVLQATMGGFHLEAYEVFKKAHDIVAVVDINHPMDKGLKQAAFWLGYRYDYLGLFGAGFVVVGGWFKRKWKNPLDSSHSMFCSEAVVRVLQASEYPGFEGMEEPGAVNPQRLLEFLVPRAAGIVYGGVDAPKTG